MTRAQRVRGGSGTRIVNNSAIAKACSTTLTSRGNLTLGARRKPPIGPDPRDHGAQPADRQSPAPHRDDAR